MKRVIISTQIKRKFKQIPKKICVNPDNLRHLRAKILFSMFLLYLPENLEAQQFQISGTVTDAATDEPLPYTNVALMPAHLGVGVMTGDDGNYALTFTTKGDSIRFSFVGYETVTVPLSEVKNGILDVQLQPLSSIDASDYSI